MARRCSILGMLAAVVLGGCGAAAATAPDRDKPGHCVAAFNYAAYWFAQGKVNERNVRVSKARGLFELDNLKRAGSFDEGMEDASTLSKEYGSDRDRMNKLVLDCASKQDTDPAFKAQYSDLLVRASAL